MAFTKEQQLAIDKEGTNIIVSAGAGSGKTAVLTERVIRKLKQGIDVDHLLVLTFTNEAANEMKKRIRDGIIDNKLYSQLNLLDSAYITTFDSFALSLVKKYNYLINVSDNLKIIDSNIITIYKTHIIEEIFESKYKEEQFTKLIADFCLKDDKSIKNFIIDISNKLDLLVDKKGYIDNYFTNFYSDEKLNELIKEYDDIIKRKITELHVIYEEFLSYIDDKLSSKLDDWLNPLFKGSNYDEYILFLTKIKPRYTKVEENGIKLKDEINGKVEEISELLRFKNKEDIKERIKSTEDYIKVIIDIILELDKKVSMYKDKYNIYEFGDISHMAIDIVKNNLDIRNEIKDYFNEIMVDEYQDTSSIQEEFISYIEKNNVYMVGDIKQSIYRFRNANPYIFEEKYRKYGNHDGGIKIDLIKNFRSRKETLNNINEIFNLIMDSEIGNADYLKSHNMIYGNTDYDKEDTKVNNNLEIYNYKMDKYDEYTKEEKELFIISEDIKNKINNKYQVFDKKTKCLRNIEYSDICIITDRNKYLETYKKILEYHNIPSVIYMDETLNNDMIVLVIKNLINLVWNVKNKIYDNKFRYLFTSVARSNLFEYDDNKIYHLLKDKNYYYDDIIKFAKEINLDKPITEVINDILEKYNVYEKLTILPDIEKNIIKISNLIKISEDINSLGISIPEFITYLDDTIAMDLPVKYTINTSNENAIKIMNIHKSKGLEFSLCYFTGMHNKFTIKEINSKFLISHEYGIILPYKEDSELKNTILRDMYINDYFIEEVSEKIRLFYVALTRCREKMIIVTSLDGESEKYSHLVPSLKRLKYRSFLDILNSIKVIDKYIIDKEANYTHDYNKIAFKEINNSHSDIKITKRKVNTQYHELENKHFSKEQKELTNLSIIKDMEYGTKIHEMLEYSSFNNPSNEYIKNLLMKIPPNFINTYHEYEFSYTLDNIKYNGIIDLMVEYDNLIYIIDYKLKNINDSEYIKQLIGYKEYITRITNKEVKTFLYSIIDNDLKEVTNE